MAKREDLPEHFQRIKETGKLRVRIGVPKECRAHLPGPWANKVELIEHLGTSDLKIAKDKEHREDVIGRFKRLIENARPVPTKWVYVPPTPDESQRMLQAIETFKQADPPGFEEWSRRVLDFPILALGQFEKVPMTTKVSDTHGLTFDAATDAWAFEKKKPPETLDLYRSSMRMFSRHLHHDNIKPVTRLDLIGWKEALVQSHLTSKSIKNRFGHVKTIARWLFENERMANDISPPDKPVRYVEIKNPHTARLNFNEDDRAAIYRAALAETGPLYRYGNLIPLFSGMRVEEYAEMDTRDIRKVDGVWCFLLNYDFKTQQMTLKNDESIRKIPIHSAILKAGFLDYVESLPPGPLFPMLKRSKHGRLRQDASRKLGEWLRETVGIVDPRKVMHSHRHSAETLMEAAGVPKARAYKITGHAAQDVGEDYIHRQVETLKDAVEKIPVPDLDVRKRA